MDTKQPLVSICVANYNGMGVLEACLQSIFAQDCNFAWEVLMHDDASTDDSVAWVSANYPQARIISSSKNVGFCTSNNRMAAAARGSYLLLLNNDAELFPDALRTLLHGTESLGGAFSDYRNSMPSPVNFWIEGAYWILSLTLFPIKISNAPMSA